ncbi:MAG: hypothetical protein EBR52_10070, partial [Microbacteriaceae bacterium]|nr:hypothetical protein [Microbacteriaceae bacterium]
TYYTNPASAEITRQLAVSRALFYNPYSGAPIVKYNQGAVYDTNAPGLASVSCFTQSAGGGTSYNSYPLRQVSASVFAGLNHPVMHAIENPFGASGSTLVYNCASPYANIPRTPLSDTEALSATLTQAMTKQTYIDRGWDFTNTWDFDDALPYLRTTSFPVSYFNATVDDTAGNTASPVIKTSISFTKTASTKVDQVKIYARPSSSSPRAMPSCSTTTDRLVATFNVSGAGMTSQLTTVTGSWNFPWDLWLCGYKSSAVVLDGMMVQSDLRPDMLRVLAVPGSLRLAFRAWVPPAVSSTFDQLQAVEAPQNATDSAIPTYCGASGSNKVVATIDLTSTTT